MISTLYVFLYVYLNVQTEKNIFTLVTENSLITGIWLIPCMHSHVLLQMFYTRKTILTLVTGIWFLPCMSFKCFRFPFCEKDSSYWSQGYGSSPVWILIYTYTSCIYVSSELLPQKTIFHIFHRDIVMYILARYPNLFQTPSFWVWNFFQIWLDIYTSLNIFLNPKTAKFQVFQKGWIHSMHWGGGIRLIIVTITLLPPCIDPTCAFSYYVISTIISTLITLHPHVLTLHVSLATRSLVPL